MTSFTCNTFGEVKHEYQEKIYDKLLLKGEKGDD